MIYGLDDPAADRTQTILERHGIAAYVIGDDVLDQTVGTVFNTEEDFDGRHLEVPQSYLLFDGFDVSGVIDVLKVLRNNGAEFHGVKVMRTELNSSWPMRNLLTRTNTSFQLGKRAIILEEMIQSCNGLDLSDVDVKARADFKKTLVDAVKLLQSGSYDLEQIDRVIGSLEKATSGVRKLYN